MEAAPPASSFNGPEMRRQLRLHHQRQLRYRLAARFVVRLAVWLLGAYLAAEFWVHAFYAYLAFSAFCVVWRVLHGPFGEAVYVSAQELAELTGAGAQTRMHDAHVAPRRVDAAGYGGAPRWRAPRPPPLAPIAADSAPSDPAPQERRREEDAVRTGALTPAQQRALLARLKSSGTMGATRCAMDPGFRCTLLQSELGDTDTCVCGSGEAFASCCAEVKECLLEVLGSA